MRVERRRPGRRAGAPARERRDIGSRALKMSVR